MKCSMEAKECMICTVHSYNICALTAKFVYASVFPGIYN